MGIKELLFEKTGLYDGCEISCTIEDHRIDNAIFRITSNSKIYIEQDICDGNEIRNEEGESRIKYNYTWECSYLEKQNKFSSEVDNIEIKHNIINEFLILKPQIVIIPKMNVNNKFENNLIVTIDNNIYIEENYNSFIKSLTTIAKKHLKISQYDKI